MELIATSPETSSVSDPLSGITRAERRWLLVSSFVLVEISWGGLVPREIEALGLRVGPSSPPILVLSCCGAAGYFLIAYLYYHRADMAEANLRLLYAKHAAADAGLAWYAKIARVESFKPERADH